MKEGESGGSSRPLYYLIRVTWVTKNSLLNFKDKFKVKGACRKVGHSREQKILSNSSFTRAAKAAVAFPKS